jgi:hypothetical protein
VNSWLVVPILLLAGSRAIAEQRDVSDLLEDVRGRPDRRIEHRSWRATHEEWCRTSAAETVATPSVASPAATPSLGGIAPTPDAGG